MVAMPMIRLLQSDQYLALLFIRNADPNRFGTLKAELSNNYSKGRDDYPTTLEKAYQLLLSYKPVAKKDASNFSRPSRHDTPCSDGHPIQFGTSRQSFPRWYPRLFRPPGAKKLSFQVVGETILKVRKTAPCTYEDVRPGTVWRATPKLKAIFSGFGAPIVSESTSMFH
jgi:hypothetical protein